jgi:predicted nucleotidyltransferase
MLPDVLPMISENDIKIIIRCAKKYNAASVILFGSSVTDDKESNDIDIGVKRIEPRLFFKFYAEVFKNMSKSLDLVDLSRKSLFNDLVEEDGVKIYG